MTPCISTALMVGGGIAGLSAAVSLSRVGVRCEVVELADAALGASLGLSGRAAQALDELGLYEGSRETGRPFSRDSTAGAFRDSTGRILSLPKRPTWPGAKDNIAVYRPAFLDVMTEAAERAGVVIRKGMTIETLENAPDHVEVTFTDGDTRRYDLVVGADGIGSRTRALLFPDAKPTYAGQLSVRWMTPGPAVEEEGWYVGPAGGLGFYHLPVQDLIYVPAVVNVPERKRMTDEEVHGVFAELLDSFPAPAVQELRRRLTPESELIARPFEWILLPDPWYRGRTLIIGDAAHATTAHMGMGGGMAVEDAAVLGQCVGQAYTLPEALQRFMARRFERVRTVVETSVKLSKLEQAHAPPSESAAMMTGAFEAIAQPY